MLSVSTILFHLLCIYRELSAAIAFMDTEEIIILEHACQRLLLCNKTVICNWSRTCTQLQNWHLPGIDVTGESISLIRNAMPRFLWNSSLIPSVCHPSLIPSLIFHILHIIRSLKGNKLEWLWTKIMITELMKSFCLFVTCSLYM